MVLENVRWALDFSKLMIDDLLEVADELESGPSESGSWAKTGR
jgi:hypothetical protein